MRWLLPVPCLLLPTFALAVPTENILIGKIVKVTDGDTPRHDRLAVPVLLQNDDMLKLIKVSKSIFKDLSRRSRSGPFRSGRIRCEVTAQKGTQANPA